MKQEIFKNIHGLQKSTKTMKVFLLEWFAVYSITAAAIYVDMTKKFMLKLDNKLFIMVQRQQ